MMASVLALPPLLRGAREAVTELEAMAQTRPNMLVLVFDALSARDMSLYGYARQTTPHLVRLAQRATVYHRHYASGNFTTPGTASLLTGVYSWLHRGLHYAGTVAKQYEERNVFRLFAEQGYHTFAYAQNPWVPILLHQFRAEIDALLMPATFCQVDGAIYDDLFPADHNVAYWAVEELLLQLRGRPGSLFLGMADRARIKFYETQVSAQYSVDYPRGVPKIDKLLFPLERTIDGLLKAVKALPEPFFAYVHLMPPHDPYRPRRDFVGLFDGGWQPAPKPDHFFSEGVSPATLAQRRREYNEYIAYTDSEFGRLCDSLQQSGQMDRTCLVVTSDHGETFERGVMGHGTPLLYEPLVHIPLLIWWPGQIHRQDVDTVTSAVDLVPSFFRLLGLPLPDWCEGRPLPARSLDGVGVPRTVFAVEAKSNPKQGPLQKATVALVRDRYKLIQYRGYAGLETEYELYDVVEDPEERVDLAEETPLAEELQGELEDRLQRSREAE